MLLTPALGAVLMAASTVIVAINARMLKIKTEPQNKAGEQASPSDKDHSADIARKELETAKKETNPEHHDLSEVVGKHATRTAWQPWQAEEPVGPDALLELAVSKLQSIS